MNKRHILYSITLLLALVLLCLTSIVMAQDEELVCDDFTDSSDEVRTGYYMGEGAAFFASGQYSRAIYSFSCVAEQVDSGYIPAYMNRAAVYTARHDYELAVEDYTSAIQLDSGLIPAYNNRGLVYTAQLEYEAALEDFNHAIELDDGYILAYNNRAVVYVIQGEYELALADLQQSITLSGIDDVVSLLSDPDRDTSAPRPEFDHDHAQAYALMGIVYSARALDNYETYLMLLGSRGDQRIQSAAGALESRFSFELRLDDGTWLLTADFALEAE